jgi:hypothetical protein
MTKRAVFLMVLLGGMALGIAFAYVPKEPSLHDGWTLAAGMMFWATVSASVTIANNSGAWGVKFSRHAPKHPGKLPGSAWPLLIVLLAVANYLTAIAIVAGHTIFKAPASRS